MTNLETISLFFQTVKSSTKKVDGHVNGLIWLNYDDSILKLVPVNLLYGLPQGQGDLSV